MVFFATCCERLTDGRDKNTVKLAISMVVAFAISCEKSAENGLRFHKESF